MLEFLEKWSFPAILVLYIVVVIVLGIMSRS